MQTIHTYLASPLGSAKPAAKFPFGVAIAPQSRTTVETTPEHAIAPITQEDLLRIRREVLADRDAV